MQEVVQKAAVLIEALPYIQKFQGATVVVKFGGSVMDDPEAIREILRDVAFMAVVGLRPVLVHGGGKAISARAREQGLVPRFVKGLRVTDEETIRIVEQVLNHEVNPELVATLESFGCRARGLHGDDIFRVEKHVETDPETGQTVDLGYVGEVVGVDAAPIEAFLQAGLTPVVTPLGRDRERRIYNVNADEAAAGLARALHARKIVFLTDVPGVLADRNDPASLLSTVRAGEVEELIARGVIDEGMLPKIRGAVKAIREGVQKAHVIDAGLPHSLLLELFTDRGVGTEIVP